MHVFIFFLPIDLRLKRKILYEKVFVEHKSSRIFDLQLFHLFPNANITIRRLKEKLRRKNREFFVIYEVLSYVQIIGSEKKMNITGIVYR